MVVGDEMQLQDPVRLLSPTGYLDLSGPGIAKHFRWLDEGKPVIATVELIERQALTRESRLAGSF